MLALIETPARGWASQPLAAWAPELRMLDAQDQPPLDERSVRLHGGLVQRVGEEGLQRHLVARHDQGGVREALVERGDA